MSDKALKAKIKELFIDELAPRGFMLKKKRMPERILPELCQGLEFQPGNGWLDRKYTVNVFWNFTIFPFSLNRFDAERRIGELTGQGDTWFSREEGELERDFKEVRSAIINQALPYLEKYNTIDKIITANEAGELRDDDAFGLFPCQREFIQGCCYNYLGRHTKAVKCFREVIDNYSSETCEWVKERKKLAEMEISRIESLK